MTVELGIQQVLDAEAPPEDDQIVTFELETRQDAKNVLHARGCPWLGGESWRTHGPKKATGATLLHSLRTNRISTVCGRCCLENKARVELLLQEDSVGSRCSVGLHYETWKLGHANEWCQWFCGKTPDQIREDAKQELDWYSRTSELQVACFGALLGDSDGDWLPGVETWVTTRYGGCEQNTLVHGLVPAHLVDRLYGFAGVHVPVDYNFSLQHLKIAVSLYEENGDRMWNRDRRLDSARKAVDTARLALI